MDNYEKKHTQNVLISILAQSERDLEILQTKPLSDDELQSVIGDSPVSKALLTDVIFQIIEDPIYNVPRPSQDILIETLIAFRANVLERLNALRNN